ncbi:MAG: tRNA epoxyqueuosine(34) reductase QueG [Gammaproteobacteria bacterium]|nr:tRNA epoxyqueuosine(34) reductase QueG [Gammaproteobacteria bacterium]MCP5459129.1 tRNA epoxyqueuosine(34) reductase QueG [Gammaproteobacteria bacterium]
MPASVEQCDPKELASTIKHWGRELGFQQVGITDADLGEHEAHLLNWLASGYHGAMEYMARHGVRRSRPELLRPGTLRIIAARMDYWPPAAVDAETVLQSGNLAYVSRYALGRDYHKVLRRRLQRLAERIVAAIGPFGYRVFVDSAPVLEKALAQKAGLGWIGKHSNLLERKAGSWFFLGELYCDLPLPVDELANGHCGRCTACIDICPTQAIVAPYRVDARRCISYHTIELHGSIPLEFRRAIGNRIYGCDDCQLVCPWNRFARATPETDFLPRHGLDAAPLTDLFSWDENRFLQRTEGSALRRLGHERWLRNIAVALGNAPSSPSVTDALQARAAHPSALVREHVAWALAEQADRRTGVRFRPS